MHCVPLFQLLDDLEAVGLDVLRAAKFSDLGMDLKLVSEALNDGQKLLPLTN